MRLGLLALAMVVACGGHPPRKRRVVRSPDGIVREPYVRPPPPVLRIVPLHPDRLAWPLRRPPSLEPHYRFGFSWAQVCERRGVLSEDVLVYTEDWCAYAKSGQFDLARALSALRSNTNDSALQSAIDLDVANLAADGRTSALVPWNPEMQETIIALEIELGHLDEASIAARSYIEYTRFHRTGTCGSDLVTWMFDLQPDAVATLPAQIRMHGQTGCGAEFRKLGCIIWNASDRGPTTECTTVSLDDHDRAISRAVTARLRWTPQASADELVEIGRYAATAMVLPDAEGFALTALQRALEGSCRVVDDVRKIVKDIDADEHKQEQFADTRVWLIAMTEQRCLEIQRRQMGN